MSDHLTQTQIEGYARCSLSSGEWLNASGHLSDCEACRRHVDAAVNGDAIYLALKSGLYDETDTSPLTHLTFEQMVGLVDGTMAGEELRMINDHLTWCERCDSEVDDLRVFRGQIAAELAQTRVAPENGWSRLIAALPSFWSKPLIFGSALATLLLVVSGWLVWQGLSRRSEDLTITTPSPSVSPTVSPGLPPERAISTVIARLNDGENQVMLDREGKLSGLDHLPPAYQRMIKRALTDQEIEMSAMLAGLTKADTLRGERNGRRGEFSVVEPVGAVTFSDRPTFRWTQLEDATGYIVEVYNEKLDLVTSSPQITDHRWTAPQGLRRGGLYYWQVRGIKDGKELKSPRPPAGQARFRVLEESKVNELAQARRSYGSSHLTLGLLYAKAGLLDEAERELRALEKANPDSTIVGQLLRRVRAMRRNRSS
jgi:hypothetical protein